MKPAVMISIIGAGQCDRPTADMAYEVGWHLSKSGAALVCGGLGGVMESACRGAKAGGGLTIGILPGEDPRGANPFVDIAIPTGLGEARNLIVVRSGQAVIAIAGEYGTLSEIAHALKMGRPVIGLHTWELSKAGQLDDSILTAHSPEQAVMLALECNPQ